MYKYDLHIHTSEGSYCGKRSAEEIVLDYVELGFDGIVLTDHFYNGRLEHYGDLPWADKMDLQLEGYRKAKEAGDKHGLKVFLGIEMNINVPLKVEILVFGITEEFLKAHENFHLMTAEEVHELLVVKHNMLTYQAHPFRKGGQVMELGTFTGIEIINGGMSLDVNRQAVEFALEHNLPVIASSDNHQYRANFCGIMTEEPLDNIRDLVQVLGNGEYQAFCNLPYPDNDPIWNHPKLIRTDERYAKSIAKHIGN